MVSLLTMITTSAINPPIINIYKAVLTAKDHPLIAPIRASNFTSPAPIPPNANGMISIAIPEMNPRKELVKPENPLRYKCSKKTKNRIGKIILLYIFLTLKSVIQHIAKVIIRRVLNIKF